jgi:hypothetical protein
MMDPARCQHCRHLADERSFMCEDCASQADAEADALRVQLWEAVDRIAEAERLFRNLYADTHPEDVSVAVLAWLNPDTPGRSSPAPDGTVWDGSRWITDQDRIESGEFPHTRESRVRDSRRELMQPAPADLIDDLPRSRAPELEEQVVRLRDGVKTLRTYIGTEAGPMSRAQALELCDQLLGWDL